MSGNILEIREIFDEVTFTTKYQIVVWFDELPNIKLGKCEITQ